jgi:probable biosynthetic protein (TIGR04098 family)
MSTLSEFWQRQRMRWHGRSVPRHHQLRRYLAYHVARHGFEIGEFSVGTPTIRMFDDSSKLKIGRYCSVAAGVTFILGGDHRTDMVTTYPLGLAVRSLGSADRTFSRGNIVIGSDVWIAANATIMSGVMIGDGAVVGAGSVVIHDVPPYAVAFGNPARVMRKRFSEEVVEELLKLRWWDLGAQQVQVLRPLLQSNDVESLIAQCQRLKGVPPASDKGTGPAKCRATRSSPGDVLRHSLSEQAAGLIRAELPGLSAGDLDTPFVRLNIDSFGMLTLRTKLEQLLGTTIDDEAWTSVVTPADVLRVVATPVYRDTRVASMAPAAAAERRMYELNMPQMALGGLSESWLFKEIGDIHWSRITNGVRMPSSRLTDAGGSRLYATFTRFQLSSTAPLAAYAENETVTIDAKTSRYGAGMFFSDLGLQGAGRSAKVHVMSSFSKYGEAGQNTSLLKGQPEIPAGCEIPNHADLPEFGHEYRARRAQVLAAPIFECEYEIIPPHDINGVGLLYFAAYPIINDICAMRFAGRAFARDFSTQHRDVFYFANSDPDETLIYRIHRWNADDDGIEMEAALSRKSDGVPMAYMVTGKKRIAP